MRGILVLTIACVLLLTLPVLADPAENRWDNDAKLNAGTDTYTIDIQDLAQLEHFFLTNKSAFKNLIADDTTYLNYDFTTPKEFFDFKTAAFTDNGKVTGIKSEPTAVSSLRIITAQQQKFIQRFFSNLNFKSETVSDK